MSVDLWIHQQIIFALGKKSETIRLLVWTSVMVLFLFLLSLLALLNNEVKIQKNLTTKSENLMLIIQG